MTSRKKDNHMNSQKTLAKNWQESVFREAKKWGHIIYYITGVKETGKRRSFVLWSCSHHPEYGTQIFEEDNTYLSEKKLGLNSEIIQELTQTFFGKKFYCSRMDDYLKEYTGKTRTTCCKYNLHSNRSKEGYQLFQKLLSSRGEHYRTEYTLLIPLSEYKGKHVKYPIECKAHGTQMSYSMQDLNYMTSCPCPLCRIDPQHKNVCVPIVKKRNGGRPGQITRHAFDVKAKYNFTCALSNSTFDLQHHHLDGSDFYPELRLDWEHNGICLCGTIHRDYHSNFLVNHSRIRKEYSMYPLSPQDYSEDSTDLVDDASNPDFLFQGAEVSRYTFLEYLRFLSFDIRSNQSRYVTELMNKMTHDSASLDSTNPRFGEVGSLTLEQLDLATQKFCLEYQGANWMLSTRQDILFANNPELWAKVENSWL